MTTEQLDKIRQESEQRKASGLAGGVREWFDIDFLIRHIDEQARTIADLRRDVEDMQEFQNQIASRMPERFDDDEAQEAIIIRWLDAGAPDE